MDPPEEKLPELYKILNLANDKCWSGAFVIWPEDTLMVYRYGLILAGAEAPDTEQIETMTMCAIAACERFYPAFAMVCWGDQTSEEAIKMAMDEAYGTS